jgi:hypothetical protein
MRRIERTNAFRSDFKREKRGQHRPKWKGLSHLWFRCWQKTSRLPKNIVTTRLAVNGVTTESATEARFVADLLQTCPRGLTTGSDGFA